MVRAAKYTFLSIVLLLGLSVAAGSVAAIPSGPTRVLEGQVLLQEQKYTSGILHGDVRLLDSVFADSFVDASSAGVVRNKRQMLAIFAAETPPGSVEERDRKITIYGDAAVVTVEFVAKGLDGGKPYAFHGRATDVWILQNGTWLCVAAHSSEME